MPKTGIRHDTCVEDRCFVPKEVLSWLSAISRELESEQKDGSFSTNNRKSCGTKSCFASSTGGEENLDVHVSGQKLDRNRYANGEKSHLVQDSAGGEKGHHVQGIDLRSNGPRVSFEGVDLTEWKPTTADSPVDDPSEITMPGNSRPKENLHRALTHLRKSLLTSTSTDFKCNFTLQS